MLLVECKHYTLHFSCMHGNAADSQITRNHPQSVCLSSYSLCMPACIHQLWQLFVAAVWSLMQHTPSQALPYVAAFNSTILNTIIKYHWHWLWQCYLKTHSLASTFSCLIIFIVIVFRPNVPEVVFCCPPVVGRRKCRCFIPHIPLGFFVLHASSAGVQTSPVWSWLVYATSEECLGFYGRAR